MGRFTRGPEIARKRRRRAKIKKLKAKIAKSKAPAEIQKFVAKIQRISPFYPLQANSAPAKVKPA